MSMVDVISKAQRDELFKSLISAVQHKQEKVGTSRWFQFTYAMESFLKIWSKRQVHWPLLFAAARLVREGCSCIEGAPEASRH